MQTRAFFLQGGGGKRGGGGVRTQFGMAKFGVVKIWNTWKNVVQIFRMMDIPGIDQETSNLEMQYFYNSAICFLCYSPVKQGSNMMSSRIVLFLL